MGKEIKKETDFWGNKKDVIYEDGNKIGETKKETSFWGNEKEVTYDNDGNKVSTTTHEDSFWNGPSSKTYDNDGNLMSETKHEQGFFENRNDIYEDGEKTGSLETKHGFLGGRKEVLTEDWDNTNRKRNDIDLTTRTIRKQEKEESREYSSSGSYSSTSKNNLEKRLRDPQKGIITNATGTLGGGVLGAVIGTAAGLATGLAGALAVGISLSIPHSICEILSGEEITWFNTTLEYIFYGGGVLGAGIGAISGANKAYNSIKYEKIDKNNPKKTPKNNLETLVKDTKVKDPALETMIGGIGGGIRCSSRFWFNFCAVIGSNYFK